MDYLLKFKQFVKNSALTPAKLGELNTLIFHEWNEEKASEILPADLVLFISKNKGDRQKMDIIFHELIPDHMRSE